MAPLNKLPILFILLVAAIFLAGCVEPPATCGNGVCEAGETQLTCPQDCPLVESHFECEKQQCEEMPGPGTDTCATDIDCQIPPTDTHLECQTQSCVEVTGVGTDTCATDADCQQCKPPSDPVFSEKMIWDVPELCGFTFGGEWHDESNYRHINIRYISPEDLDQHSEYALNVYNSLEDASARFAEIVSAPGGLYNVSTKEVNGNTILEGISNLPTDNSRYLTWISGVNILTGYNGNDIGTVIDDLLLDVLTDEYLEKYPSTYNCGTDCPSPGNQKEISVAAINLQRANYSLQNLETKINSLVAAHPVLDLIVTPEYLFYNNDFKEDPVIIDCESVPCTVTSIGTTKSDTIINAVEFLQGIAAQNNVNIVFGTIAERIDIDGADVSISTQLIIDNAGIIIGKHRATKKAEFYTANLTSCEEDMAFCDKVYAAQMETVNTFSLTSAEGEEFEVIPVICGEKQNPDFINALSGANADIAALSEVDQDCDYEETTRRIQAGEHLLGLPDIVCTSVIQEIMLEWADEGVLKQNGYWLVSNGGSVGQIGIISWAENTIDNLEITADYIYGKVTID